LCARWINLSKTNTNMNCVWRFISYRAVNTLCPGYKNELFRAVLWSNRCLFWDPLKNTNTSTRAVRKVPSHFEYLEKRSRGLDVTWQPVRGDLTVHPWIDTLPWG
jgi:hypothetical protein